MGAPLADDSLWCRLVFRWLLELVCTSFASKGERLNTKSGLAQSDRASEYHLGGYLSLSIQKLRGAEECCLNCIRRDRHRPPFFRLDERSLFAKMGADALHLPLDSVRGLERRFVWISRERSRSLCRSYGVSFSDRHWDWVSGVFWRLPTSKVDSDALEESTQRAAWRALRTQGS